MAEIDIEKKKSPVWPWVVLVLLVVAAIIWWASDDDPDVTRTEQVVTSDRDRDRDITDDRVGQTDRRTTDRTTDQTNQVQMYVNYVNENEENIAESHEYSSNALTRLADALEEVVTEKGTTTEHTNAIQQIREQANQLTQDPASEEHADILSKAATNAASVIQNLQQTHYPDNNGEVEEVMQAAQSIDPSVMVTEQKDAITRFFNESAEALEAMTRDA